MIPDFQTLMRPVLALAGNGEIRISEVVDVLADEFALSVGERAQTLPSSGQTVLYNRAQWAKTYLKQAGLLELTRRAHFRVTERGRRVLENGPARIDIAFLDQFPDFREFRDRKKSGVAAPSIGSEGIADGKVDAASPEDILADAHQRIVDALATDLIERLRNASPAFFERTIVSLLLSMGYGGSSEEAGRAIGQSGDKGVDGVIDQDPLGVDQIYVQAKRYDADNVIGPAPIREFSGALNQKKAPKGILVTTSSFTKSALETAREIGRIVLIDGEQLGRLLVRYNVGCRDKYILHVKDIDEDFFV